MPAFLKSPFSMCSHIFSPSKSFSSIGIQILQQKGRHTEQGYPGAKHISSPAKKECFVLAYWVSPEIKIHFSHVVFSNDLIARADGPANQGGMVELWTGK